MVRSNATFVRWRRGESRRCRVFPALEPDHPAFDAMCLLCAHKLGLDVAEQGVRLVAVGPEAVDRERFMQGRWTGCHALICHTYCVAQRSDLELDEFVLAIRMVDVDPESETV